jgi:hypothetical protein
MPRKEFWLRAKSPMRLSRFRLVARWWLFGNYALDGRQGTHYVIRPEPSRNITAHYFEALVHRMRTDYASVPEVELASILCRFHTMILELRFAYLRNDLARRSANGHGGRDISIASPLRAQTQLQQVSPWLRKIELAARSWKTS